MIEVKQKDKAIRLLQKALGQIMQCNIKI